MNRQQALAIFSTMNDDKLFEALDAVGIPSDEGGMSPTSQEMGLEPWNARDVEMGQGSGGEFVDRSRFATRMPETQRRQNPEPDYKKYQPQGYEDLQAYAAPEVMG
jgi:hypothetical protein